MSHVITVGKLIELLKEYPENLPVASTEDDEGNNYRPLNGYGYTAYFKNFDFEKIYWEDVCDTDDEEGLEDWTLEEKKNAIKVLVIG